MLSPAQQGECDTPQWLQMENKTQSTENEIENIKNNFNLSWHHLDVYISWEPLPEFANAWAIVGLWLIF